MSKQSGKVPERPSMGLGAMLAYLDVYSSCDSPGPKAVVTTRCASITRLHRSEVSMSLEWRKWLILESMGMRMLDNWTRRPLPAPSASFRSIAVPGRGFLNHTITRETVDHGISVDNAAIVSKNTNRTSIQEMPGYVEVRWHLTGARRHGDPSFSEHAKCC